MKYQIKNSIIIAYVSLAVLFIACVVCAILLFSKPQLQTLTQSTLPTGLNPENVDLKIKGNKNSKIYHLKDCPNYDDISDGNIIWFKTKEEAKAPGYRQAKNC